MVRGVVKFVTTRGLRRSLEVIIQELQLNIRHLRGTVRARAFEKKRGLKLNIGCGSNRKEGWVNIDLGSHADLTLDLRESLPFLTNSCHMIYSEHFLEHLDYPEPTVSFISECFRVLEPGGEFSLGVPDTEWPILEYAGQREEGYFQFVKKRWHPVWCETEMEHLNYHFRMGNDHRFAYDFKTIEKLLVKGGFEHVHCREFNQDLDTQDRAVGTLYVTAMKPNG